MSLTQQNSTLILERFHRGRPGANTAGIDLTLRPAYLNLLKKLGEPHRHLPPVFHVAGTNGKGSTCAFLRSILEAAGYKVHVYTSPHLISYHERIRIKGQLIEENELVNILTECESKAEPGAITIFEAITASAFVAFAKHKADFTILETGLGGRLDCTNVVEEKRATLITRLSYDHREFLGSTLAEIAREKAGIMRKDVPCFVASQSDAESMITLRNAASAINAPLRIAGQDWDIEPRDEGFRYTDNRHTLDLPAPALIGAHQFGNAGLAIAALLGTGFSNTAAIPDGLRKVEWPARLQHLATGILAQLLPQGWELWLDGGHNDSAGEVLAAQAEKWKTEKENLPLHLVLGMIKTKKPEEFLQRLAPHVASLHCIPVPTEPQSFSVEELQQHITGIKKTKTSPDVSTALRDIAMNGGTHGRILICGSLYLAGEILKQNAK